MKSPFRIFRKHQKGVMVVIILGAIFLFTVGDTVLKMFGGTGGPQGGKVTVETNIGKLTQRQIHNLMQQRKTVHNFIARAYARSHSEMEKSPFFNQMLPYVVQRYGFGRISETEILYAWLYRHEARKLGIVVSDKQVEEYIDGFTDRKLSSNKFKELLREMQIGPKELFDIIRDELQAVTAYRMKLPVVVPSPEKYWEYYQQLNTKEKIEVAALPVKEFTGQAPEPTGAQIVKLFEKHKDDVEQAFEGEFKPGFRQPHRVKLQYLELSFADMEAKARAAGPVTEKEIDEYYESKKDLDRRFHEADAGLDDDAGPLDPGFVPEDGDTMPKDEPDSDADSAKPEEQPGQPAEESAKPPVRRQPGEDPKSNDSPPDEKPQGDTPQDKPGCSGGVDDDENEKPAAKPQADVAPKNDDAETKEPGETKSENELKDADDSEAKGEEEAAPKGPKIGTGKTKPHEAPKIKYKPLDDELREIIRESIIQERARKLMKDLVAKARDAMSKVAAGFAVSKDVKLTDPDAKQLVMLEQRADEKLNEIAETFSMKFGQTPLVSMLDLSEFPGLGKAQEPGSFDPARGESTSIVEQAFGSDALCRVFESETLDSEVYLCWKVRDVSLHVPDLKEPGVREQVVAAWKRSAALPLAKKRAEELAQRARTSDKGFAEALAGETVTGDSQGTALAVAESKEFSFWREPTAPNPINRSREQPVQLDDPGVVTNPSRKFMHAIFDELGEGDIGVALNNDATVYYVVKVISRHPADREAFKDVALFAQNSPYAYLSQLDQQVVLLDNDERIREKYAVKWHNVPGREQGQMTADDE